ncbi:MAG: glucosamine-6-phosphate deaminase [Coriobacteriales bacterium]|nr:glucosamine-6-phosphate deaminase [Coriobacteriales bacterium]
MKVIIQKDYDLMCQWASEHIINAINEYEAGETAATRPFVLGLPTGSSPLGVYERLIKACAGGRVSFKNVITFNMDEYVDLPKDHPESYWSFMHTNFFDHIDIDPANINILDGNAADLQAECDEYEARITAAGGIDLFLGGAGEDGHIAFNEPFTSLASRTGLRTLTSDTRAVNARFFDDDPTLVPAQALSVGVGTVCDAREVVILISGRKKARALRDCVEGGVNQMCTLSALNMHNNATIACDEDACAQLKVESYKYFKDVYANEILQ